MSLHRVGDAAVFRTKLMGSTKRLLFLHVTGISSVQLPLILGSTSTGWHLVT